MLYSESYRTAKSCISKLGLKLGISYHSQLHPDMALTAPDWDLEEQLLSELSILFILYLLVLW